MRSKSLLLCFFLVFANHVFADIPRELLKKILNANASFEQYQIKFERKFKYPLEKDTLSEVYISNVFRTDLEYYIGYQQINYLKSNALRSLVASNTKGMYRVNFSNNISYKTLLADNEPLLIKNLNNNVYKPLLYSRADLMAFSEKNKDERYIYLEKIDSIKDQKKRFVCIEKTIVLIDRQTYIPMSEETFTVGKINNQYSLYKLIDYQLLEKSAYKPILITSDSFIAIIAKYPDGDSIKNSRKDLYQKIKPGDTLNQIMATLFRKANFKFQDIKDSIVLLDFFYTTCAPCIEASPELNSLYSNFKNKGVYLFGINAFETDWANVKNYVADHQILYPIVETNKQTLYNFGVTGFPRLLIIKNGVLIKIIYGYNKGITETIIKDLNQLLTKP
jgi:thiol-disulfide isomerase/thioredoxin